MRYGKRSSIQKTGWAEKADDVPFPRQGKTPVFWLLIFIAQSDLHDVPAGDRASRRIICKQMTPLSASGLHLFLFASKIKVTA